MPRKIMMTISNGNPTVAQINAYLSNSKTSASTNKLSSGSLNSSMIGRIHSIKPGCGSCGR